MNRVKLLKSCALLLGILCVLYADINGSVLQALAPIGVLLCFCFFIFAERLTRYKADPGKYAEDVQIAKEKAARRDFDRDSGSMGE